MKSRIKSVVRPLIFILIGSLVGLGYYYFIGCSSGSCPLVSNPFITMGYTGIIGGLLSVIFQKGDKDQCNM